MRIVLQFDLGVFCVTLYLVGCIPARLPQLYILTYIAVVLVMPAETRVCADGGANRLYDELPSMIRDEDTPSVCCRYGLCLLTPECEHYIIQPYK